MFSREKKTFINEWWWTIDKQLLAALLLLLGIGVAMSFAASPSVATRLGYSSWHFIFRHMFFLIPTLIVLFGASFLTQKLARYAALLMLVGSIGLLMLTPFFGFEANGAKRWILIFGQSIQPSEFVKPAYAIIAAWLFSEKLKRGNVPGGILASVLMLIIVALLIVQPDFGQTVLVFLTWAFLLFISGISWWVIIVLIGLTLLLGLSAYIFLPHVAKRFDGFFQSFLNPEVGASYQVEKALQSLLEGGWFGRGPGEAIVKKYLPDAHADYVFSAAAGEFGIIFCLFLVALIAFIVLKGLGNALAQTSLFARLAISTIAMQFGLQSIINLAVNLNLVPSKGMTLPFVSYGGTSMVAIAFGMGIMLALSRKKPQESLPSGLPAFRNIS
jgi:cell division protein FtsW